MKCLNIVVFYNNGNEVKKYIKEVLGGASNELVKIIIVKNLDTYNELNKIIEELNEEGILNLEVVDYGENVGYLNAFLKTIKNINLNSFKYYILSNTDIHYCTDNFFGELLNGQYAEDVGCIAPSVYSTKTKSYSNPHYLNRIPREKIIRNIRIFSYPTIAQAYLRGAEKVWSIKKKIEQESGYVYSPHGCYMIFTKEFVKRIQGYEYGVKMYSEESCVGELLIRSDLKCFYDSSLKLMHDESTVTGKINYRKRFKYWASSLEYILNEFY